jgi:predicted Zn-dependent peptidase
MRLPAYCPWLRTVSTVLVSLALLVGAGEAHARQTAEPMPPNPFAVFETFRLPNGMKVWYGHLPASTLTSMAVIVPYGRDHDPPGREQTAHLLEHVLLSDRQGRSEAELTRELTSRGGGHNGMTGSRSTIFPLSIGTDQAAFGLRWLHDVIAPRRLHDQLVDRNREPVAIELATRRPAYLPEWVSRYVAHPRLVPAPFWRREFGMDAQEERGNSQLRGLAAITARDVQAFFDTWYAPAAMTLVIVTGAPREELQPLIDATFGALPWRPTPDLVEAYAPRTTPTRLFQYRPGSSTRLALRYRIGELSGLDQLRLIFIEDLLRHRLMERLRRGEDKAVYSIATNTSIRGPAAFFGIQADVQPRQERRVRAIIDDELRRIAMATEDTAAFYADRDALGRRLRVENASPAALRGWATDRFYQPDLHERFPDVGEYYAAVGPDSIAALAARIFTDEARILFIWRPLPVPAALLLAAAALTVLLGARLYRRAALRPADMTRVRYVARIRPPRLARLLTIAALAAALLVLGRLAIAAAHFLAHYWLLATDSFTLLLAAAAGLLLAATLAAFTAAGRLRTKVIVFEHELRIKSPTYRAATIPRQRISGLRVVHNAAEGLPHRVVPPFGRGVVLTLDDGSSLLLRVERPAELAAVLMEPRLVPLPDTVPEPVLTS